MHWPQTASFSTYLDILTSNQGFEQFLFPNFTSAYFIHHSVHHCMTANPKIDAFEFLNPESLFLVFS